MRRAAVGLAALAVLSGCGPAAPPGFSREHVQRPLAQPGAGLPRGATAVRDLTGRATIRPRTLSVDNHDTALALRWRGWGTPRAVGTGRFRYTDCTPDCADARPRVTALQVFLTGTRRCFGRRWYGRAELRYRVQGRWRRTGAYVRSPC